MTMDETPNESDLLAELAAADQARANNDAVRGRRGRFALLIAVLLACGAFTIVQLSLSSTPSTSYKADPQTVAKESAPTTTAPSEPSTEPAPAPETAPAPEPVPTEQAPAYAEPAVTTQPPAAATGGQQNSGNSAPKPKPQPQPAPAPQPAPEPAPEAPPSPAPPPAPAPEPTPAPTCQRWYWAGLEMHDGQLMNKYNVQGTIHYLPLSAPHNLNRCW